MLLGAVLLDPVLLDPVPPGAVLLRAVLPGAVLLGAVLPGAVLPGAGLWIARLELTSVEPGRDLRHLVGNLRSDRTWTVVAVLMAVFVAASSPALADGLLAGCTPGRPAARRAWQLS